MIRAYTSRVRGAIYLAGMEVAGKIPRTSARSRTVVFFAAAPEPPAFLMAGFRFCMAGVAPGSGCRR